MDKTFKTDRDWRDEAVAALADLPPRATREKIARLIALWNDRVPEFFSRMESPANAVTAASCGKCVTRYRDVLQMRVEMLDRQFNAEAEAARDKIAEAPKRKAKRR